MPHRHLFNFTYYRTFHFYSKILRKNIAITTPVVNLMNISLINYPFGLLSQKKNYAHSPQSLHATVMNPLLATDYELLKEVDF